MSAARFTIAACAACAVASAWADEPAPAQPAWEFALTAYPTVVQGADDNYTSAKRRF